MASNIGNVTDAQYIKITKPEALRDWLKGSKYHTGHSDCRANLGLGLDFAYHAVWKNLVPAKFDE